MAGFDVSLIWDDRKRGMIKINSSNFSSISKMVSVSLIDAGYTTEYHRTLGTHAAINPALVRVFVS